MPKIFLIRQGLQQQHELLTQHQTDFKQQNDTVSCQYQKLFQDILETEETVKTSSDFTQTDDNEEANNNQGKNDSRNF